MGVGSDLDYISDNGMEYTGMFPENMDEYDNETLVELIKIIEDGGDLDSIFNVDSFLKYLAVSTMTVHSDSYQGGMYHNYYLYNNNGIFEWISWDLNMIFNGFTRSGLTDLEATEYLIDEPVTGEMSKYPLIEAIFKNEEYVEQYHEYLEILSEGYLSEDNINEKVLSVYQMIKSYVESDPSSFYTYDEFEKALFQDEDNSLGILSFVEKRVANVAKQLSGEISSTNNGEGNSGSGGGMGGRQQGMNQESNDGVYGEIPELEDGERPARPEAIDGEMSENPENVDGERSTKAGGMESEAVNKEIVDEDSSTISTTNIIIFLSMLVLTIGASAYLSRKH
jgi:spore coat protein CotH